MPIRSVPGGRKRLSASVAAVSLALAVALAIAGCGRDSANGRVIVLGLDGMDPRVVDLLMSEGKLPHFARLRQDGAYGRLLSSKPLLSPVVWTTIATGKTPEQHGIGHFAAIDDKTGEQLPVTSGMRRAQALWNILSDKQRTVATVGWWATWPPENVNGDVVSDHTCYHFLFRQGQTGAESDAGLTHPSELFARIAPLVRRPRDRDPVGGRGLHHGGPRGAVPALRLQSRREPLPVGAGHRRELPQHLAQAVARGPSRPAR